MHLFVRPMTRGVPDVGGGTGRRTDGRRGRVGQVARRKAGARADGRASQNPGAISPKFIV